MYVSMYYNRHRVKTTAFLQDEEEEHPEKDRISSKQIKQSEIRLNKLLTDGTTLVTNVKVAGDSKEVARRQEEDEAKRARSFTPGIG